MLVDRYGKSVEVGDWFIRLDQNSEGRLYLLEGFTDDGRIHVHEHNQHQDSYRQPITHLSPVRLKQTIKKPSPILWYPEALLPEVRQ